MPIRFSRASSACGPPNTPIPFGKLTADLEGQKLPSGAAIGHTRWATHGAPTESNAHPHADCSGRVVVVHNGIIENHRELATELVTAGHLLTSETDTEVVAHLVEAELRSGITLLEALRLVLPKLRGDFALALVSADEPDVLVTARRSSPLVLGRTETSGLVGSDVAALLAETRELYLLGDDELAELRPGSIAVVGLDGEPRELRPLTVSWDVAAAEKGGYADFMSKEILRAAGGGGEDPPRSGEPEPGSARSKSSASTPHSWRRWSGSCSSPVGRATTPRSSGATRWSRFARIPTDADIASEFRYRDLVLSDKTRSSSPSASPGETADTLHAVRRARQLGAVTIAMTNVVDSLMVASV